jgi:hypothetical protein
MQQQAVFVLQCHGWSLYQEHPHLLLHLLVMRTEGQLLAQQQLCHLLISGALQTCRLGSLTCCTVSLTETGAMQGHKHPAGS